MIRPGSRVLCMPGGTGYAPSWLGKHVGRSGGVVSIESDKESVLFAQKRYGAPNVAFEQGGIAALRGEIDGAFDAVLSITHHVVDPGADVEVLREMWRVTRPGGWMLVGRGGGGVSPAEVLERVRGIAVVPASPDERGEEGASEQSNGGSRPGGRTGGRGERRGEGHGEGRGADRGADRGGAREPGRGQSETGEGTPLSAPVEVISETSDPVCLAIARKPEV